MKDKIDILIVDDDVDMAETLSDILTALGIQVEIAHDGCKAVEKAKAKMFDIVLMDIKMPVMDGYTAIKLIREKNTKIPIIAQTAYADDREKAIECGCSGFISKPFDKKDLFKILFEFI